jgi:glycosyltransferase involved in cell wall biosynthesis
VNFGVLVVGPPEHGVTAAALAQWEFLRLVPGARLVRGLPASSADLPDGPTLVHVTDRLFGADADEAADVVTGWAARKPLVLVLHDLPQPSDGPVNHPRRSRAYRRMADAAARVVVSSRHEERLLAACGSRVRCDVIPLPVPEFGQFPQFPPAPVDPDGRLETVAVLGYLYPGKGHEEVLAALSVLPADVGLTALGRASDGHEDLVDDLSARARAHGREFRVTGWIPDGDLVALLRSAVLPVAPHAHLSASGSLNTWIGAGRRPLAPRSDYVVELLERMPDAVWLYDDLGTALREAWEKPALTWFGGRGRPTVQDTVEDVLRILVEVSR